MDVSESDREGEFGIAFAVAGGLDLEGAAECGAHAAAFCVCVGDAAGGRYAVLVYDVAVAAETVLDDAADVRWEPARVVEEDVDADVVGGACWEGDVLVDFTTAVEVGGQIV